MMRGKAAHHGGFMKLRVLPGSQLPLNVEAAMEELYNIEKQIEMQREWIESLENDDDLAIFKEKLDKAQKELENKRDMLKIPIEGETLQTLTTKRDELLRNVATMIPDNAWGKNAMSKGKKDEVSSTGGKLRIIRSTRTERTILPTKVLERFPFVIESMVNENLIKIPIKYAELKMSKEQINEVAIKTTKHTYETQVRDGSNGTLLSEQ